MKKEVENRMNYNEDSDIEDLFLTDKEIRFYPQYLMPVSDPIFAKKNINIYLIKGHTGISTQTIIIEDIYTKELMLLVYDSQEEKVNIISEKKSVMSRLFNVSLDQSVRVFNLILPGDSGRGTSMNNINYNSKVSLKDIISSHNDETKENILMITTLVEVLHHLGYRLYDDINDKLITEENLSGSPRVEEYEEELTFEDTILYEKYFNSEKGWKKFNNIDLEVEGNPINYFHQLLTRHMEFKSNRKLFPVESNMYNVVKGYYSKNSTPSGNLLSMTYFTLIKRYSSNVSLYIITDGKEIFKLYPYIKESESLHTILDFHTEEGVSEGPLSFDDLYEARSTLLKVYPEDKEVRLIAIDSLPPNIGPFTVIDSDIELMKIFLTDIEDNSETINEMLSEEYIVNEAINTKNLRRQIQDHIIKVFDLFDPTGSNSERYKEHYNKMSDDKFLSEMKKFVNSDKNFYLETLPTKNEPTLKEIKKVLEYLKVPENEYVYYRHDGDSDNPIRTRYKVSVG